MGFNDIPPWFISGNKRKDWKDYELTAYCKIDNPPLDDEISFKGFEYWGHKD